MDKQEILNLLNKPLDQLIFEANAIKKQFIQDKFELCTIMNAKSGSCAQDCKFCAQSCHYHTEIEEHKLSSKQEIFEAAKKAQDIGAKRFSPVTSGNNLKNDEVQRLADVMDDIRAKLGMELCASLGELTKEQLVLLSQAGMTRYHHNIETSRNYYKQIVTTHDYDDRINMVKLVKSLGLEICCGGILGMGESFEDRIDMLLTLQELNVDIVPLNVLIPILGTPFKNVQEILNTDVIRTIAIYRIVLKDKGIKLAAGRESKLKDFQAMAFFAGANGMLIGGYLTVNGRSIEEDQKLLNEIKNLSL